jgi:hypothetical protein
VALQQYRDDEGHFSLVRYIGVRLIYFDPGLLIVSFCWQQLQAGGSGDYNEWRLRLILNIFVSPLPRDAR